MPLIRLPLALVSFLAAGILSSAAAAKPNIILLLTDDAGIGDTEPYNALFKTPDSIALVTPNVRHLAEEGLTFTRAHSTGAVCNPIPGQGDVFDHDPSPGAPGGTNSRSSVPKPSPTQK